MKLEEIEYVASKQSGVYVVGANGQERFTELTLRTLEDKTPLIRCHRQYLINPDRIKEIQFTDNGLAEIITLAGLYSAVSRRFLSPLKDRLGIGEFRRSSPEKLRSPPSSPLPGKAGHPIRKKIMVMLRRCSQADRYCVISRVCGEMGRDLARSPNGRIRGRAEFGFACP